MRAPLLATMALLLVASCGQREPSLQDLQELFGRDRYGDALPSGAVTRLGSVRFLTDYSMSSLAYSPDGKYLATIASRFVGLTPTGIQVWNVETGGTAGLLPDRNVYGVAWSPDSRRFATCSDFNEGKRSVVEVWSLETFRPLRLVESDRPYRCVAWSPDGNYIAVCPKGGPISLCDPRTGRQMIQLDGAAQALDFSPDSKLLAAGTPGLTIWDLSQKKVIHRAQFPEDLDAKLFPYCVDFSPDGKSLAFSYNPGLWEFEKGAGSVSLLSKDNPNAFSVMYSPDGTRMVSAGFQDKAAVWDVASKRKLSDHWLRGWSAAFSPDGKTLALLNRRITFIDASTGEERDEFAGHRSGVVQVTVTPDGDTVVSRGYGRTIREWNIVTGRLTRTRRDCASYALSPDGKTLAVRHADTEQSGVTLQNFKTGETITQLDVQADFLSFSPQGGQLACIAGPSKAGDEVRLEVSLWDTQAGKRTGVFAETVKEVHGFGAKLVYSPDGTLLAQTYPMRGAVRIRDAKTGESIRLLQVDHAFFLPVAFSPDGRRLAIGSHKVEIMDVKTGNKLTEMAGRQVEYINALRYSPCGKLIAVAAWKQQLSPGDHSQYVIRVLSAATGQRLLVLSGHKGQIRDLAFTPDGSSLVSASEDSTLLVWNIRDAQVAEQSRERR